LVEAPLGLTREGVDSLEVPLRFFEHGCMRALLQHDLAGVADAPDQGGGDRVRAHVVPAADDKGRAVDLTESVAHVPAAERARHRPLVRALHRPVHVSGLLRVHPLELGTRLGSPVEVAVEVRLHRLFILRIVVGTRPLVPVEDLDDGGRECVS